MKQGTGSKLGKEFQGCHFSYLTCMQSTVCKMPGRMNHKQKPDLLGEISTNSDIQMIPL